MKFKKMTETLGLNWFLFFGIILLIVSIALILFGLNNNISTKFFFNVSRLLALLSVAGIWYFGNILTKNTTKEIEVNKKKTAEAIGQTKLLELDISKAKQETEKAKQETENVKLEIEKVNKEAEKAKQKTQKIKLEVEKAIAEAEKAKLEREKLINQQRFIKSISAQIVFKIPTIRKDSFKNESRVYYPSNLMEKAPLALARSDKRSTMFFLTSWSEHQISKIEKKVILNYSKPEQENNIFGTSLDYFKELSIIDCICAGILKKNENEIDKGKLISVDIQLTVNGIIALKTTHVENYMGEFIKERFTHHAEEKFKNVPNIVLNNLDKN